MQPGLRLVVDLDRPGAGSDYILNYLAQSGVNIIGSEDPPAALKDHWVATIHPDLSNAIREIFPKLLKSQSGGDMTLPLTIGDANSALL